MSAASECQALAARKALEARSSAAPAPSMLAPEMLSAIRQHPTTCTDDPDEAHRRIGWLICALDVLKGLQPAADTRLEALLQTIDYCIIFGWPADMLPRIAEQRELHKAALSISPEGASS